MARDARDRHDAGAPHAAGPRDGAAARAGARHGLPRLLVLHARGRHGAAVAGGLLGVGAATAALGLAVEDARAPLAVLAPLVVVSLLAFALAGADPVLERATPWPWPRWRVGELGALMLVGAVALVPTLALGDVGAVLRNAAGLGGLAVLGAAILGARLAWLVPSAWAFGAAAAGPDVATWLDPLVWLVLPPGQGEPLAAALAVTGAVVHARIGPKPA